MGKQRGANSSPRTPNSRNNSQAKTIEFPSMEQLYSYREELKDEFDQLIGDELPKGALEFKALLESPEFSYDRLEEVLSITRQSIARLPPTDIAAGDKSEQPPVKEIASEKGLKIFHFSNGAVESNAKIVDMIDKIRPKLRDSVELVNKIRLYILFLVPKIEDGNNFGVGVQQEVISGARSMETSCATYIDGLSSYFVNRAGLVTKIAKFPDVEDYRRAVIDMDEKQFLNNRLVVTEMRNNFAVLHDVIMKNIEKVKIPRNSDHHVLY